MARTNYDPLDRDPIFDGTLDPDIDDDAEARPAVRPRPAPTLNRDGLACLCAAAIRFEAARRGLSQMQIAAEVGLSRAAVSDRFRGRTAWTLDQVGVIAQLFGCDPAVLVNEPRKPVRDVTGNYW
ncbi:helix-turn-helix domain-containing protein [Promicromonospora panici]|uniref:helix-turn-helix domain-containing protein n=1 Tax=Promicromonospora panici TaxID=2219658 RepID=UPI00101DABDD|nr:helix-turn-helix transcriptional regulator [Promicromonospora panici]